MRNQREDSSAFLASIRRRIALALAIVTSSARAEFDLKAVRGSFYFRDNR